VTLNITSGYFSNVSLHVFFSKDYFSSVANDSSSDIFHEESIKFVSVIKYSFVKGKKVK
jgi:hypothetical protein